MSLSAVAACLAGYPAGSSAATSATAWSAVARYSAAHASSFEIAGTVLGTDGSAAPGAAVLLLAEPSNAALTAAGVGSTVTLQPIARAVTNASGRYTVGVPAGTALTGLVGSDGRINAAVISTVGSSFGVRYASGAVQVQTVGAAPEAASETAPTPVQAGAMHLSAGLVAPGSAATPDSGGPPAPCTQTTIADYGPRKVAIGSTYSKTSSASSTFSYSAGQSSSLGVGMSEAYGAASFSADGTHDVSSTSSVTYPTEVGAKNIHYWTYFHYKQFEVGCFNGSWKTVEAVDWDGGAVVSSTGALAASHCLPYVSGSTYTNTKTSAYTYSTGASLASVIGINLSSHTGYSHDATVSIHLSATKPLCGLKGYPNGTSPAPALVGAAN